MIEAYVYFNPQITSLILKNPKNKKFEKIIQTILLKIKQIHVVGDNNIIDIEYRMENFLKNGLPFVTFLLSSKDMSFINQIYYSKHLLFSGYAYLFDVNTDKIIR